MEDSKAIGDVFDEQGISFERDISATSAKDRCGNYKCFFCVPDDQFETAVEIIKSYYEFLDAPLEAVSGTCPACNASVNNAFECPDCGLALSFDSREMMKNHPFTRFLEELEKTGELVR